jgi:hypothetical protein
VKSASSSNKSDCSCCSDDEDDEDSDSDSSVAGAPAEGKKEGGEVADKAKVSRFMCFSSLKYSGLRLRVLSIQRICSKMFEAKC